MLKAIPAGMLVQDHVDEIRAFVFACGQLGSESLPLLVTKPSDQKVPDVYNLYEQSMSDMSIVVYYNSILVLTRSWSA